MKQSDLKACPFDDHFPSVILHADEGEVELEEKYYIKCSYCGAEGPHCTSEEGACNSWNHRYKEQNARPVRKAKSLAQNTKEICHTAPNSASTQIALDFKEVE